MPKRLYQFNKQVQNSLKKWLSRFKKWQDRDDDRFDNPYLIF
jgi:hypothetical protein